MAKHKQNWKDSFYAVIKKNNDFKANGQTVAAYATRQRRSNILLKGFRDLRRMGFKFKTVRALRGKHIEALVQSWEEAGLSASTMQLNLSTFRTFAHWIDKPGMVGRVEDYVSSPELARRSYAAKSPKGWTDQGVDVSKKIARVRALSPRVADSLLLQLHFGLRAKESLLLQPHVADQGHTLIISHGTKGGRDRFIPIKTAEQRALLDRIKGYVNKTESLVPPRSSYKAYRNHYYYVLAKNGISRKDGVTSHGLRHEYLNNLYKQTTGHETPVNGGRLSRIDRELDSLGRQLVSEHAGHSRESISAAYIGSK